MLIYLHSLFLVPTRWWMAAPLDTWTFFFPHKGLKAMLYLLLLEIAQENWYHIQFSSVQSLSRVRLFATPWIAAHQASLSITISRSSLRLTSIESVMASSHLILCHPLLLLPPIRPLLLVNKEREIFQNPLQQIYLWVLLVITSKEGLGNEWTKNIYDLLFWAWHIETLSKIKVCQQG